MDDLITFILYVTSARDKFPIPLHWLYIYGLSVFKGSKPYSRKIGEGKFAKFGKLSVIHQTKTTNTILADLL